MVLQDVDDNVPVFEREVYVATLKENSPPETLVTQMIAYDADSEKHSQIEYEIIQGKRSLCQFKIIHFFLECRRFYISCG